MVLDSKILKLQLRFGVSQPEDWRNVKPEWILAQDGIGPVTLEHIRIYLAARDLTLKDDRTPEYWRENLSATKIGQQMGYDDHDVANITPFTILIDSAEQQPFLFQGIKGDAGEEGRPWIVKTEWRPLGRHPDSLGDYSLDGFVGRVHVERKSVEDCQGTILGFDGRRNRFERELENLDKCEAPLIVVEASFQTLIQSVQQRGKKTQGENAKTLMRSVLAYQQDYRVPWCFCDSRRLAEISTFRFLERFWRKHSAESKETERLVAAM